MTPDSLLEWADEGEPGWLVQADEGKLCALVQMPEEEWRERCEGYGGAPEGEFWALTLREALRTARESFRAVSVRED